MHTQPVTCIPLLLTRVKKLYFMKSDRNNLLFFLMKSKFHKNNSEDNFTVIFVAFKHS